MPTNARIPQRHLDWQISQTGRTRICLGLLLLITIAAPPRTVAQGPAVGYPSPAINIRDYGARDDGQESASQSSTCTVTGTAVSCTAGVNIFASTDVGKTIVIPGAGSVTRVSPAPFPSWISTIVAIVDSSDVTIATAAPRNTPAGKRVDISWGTDNGPALTAAANACPSPSNFAMNLLSGFTSKGCVLIATNGGNLGTGDYMFATGATISNATSMQIIGMGNTSRQETSLQAGVRFITAAPITILTIGQNPTVGPPINNNFGSFQIKNISFRDTSGDAPANVDNTLAGQALGGLLIYNASNAIIENCSFENFDGMQAVSGATITTVILSYGIQANPADSSNPGSGFNNNIVLRDVKGRNNSVLYDSSMVGQDGPIVIGGDIFPQNTINAAPAAGTSFGQACYGIINSGPIRLYGTHFDVREDQSGTTNTCAGVLVTGGGIIDGKFESAGNSQGTGVLLLGGGSTPQTITGVVDAASNTIVTLTVSSPNVVVGELISVSGLHPTEINGTFVVSAVTSTQISYNKVNTGTPSLGTGPTVTGIPSRLLDVKAILSNTGVGVQINQGASDSHVSVVSGRPANPLSGTFTPVMDSGTDDLAEILDNVTGFSLLSSPTVSSAATSTGAGFTGGAVQLTTPNGGTSSSVSSAPGGSGGPITLTTGSGGNGVVGGAGGSGGAITLQTGAAGTGGTGAGGVIDLLTNNSSNGVEVSASGVLAAKNSGHVNADQFDGGLPHDTTLVFVCQGIFTSNTTIEPFPAVTVIACTQDRMHTRGPRPGWDTHAIYRHPQEFAGNSGHWWPRRGKRGSDGLGRQPTGGHEYHMHGRDTDDMPRCHEHSSDYGSPAGLHKSSRAGRDRGDPI